jgi:translation initiation factor 3 subunit H
LRPVRWFGNQIPPLPLNFSSKAFQVVTKILKHGREAPSTTAHGLLLGLDLDGILEVSNSFPLPNVPHDDDEKSTKSIGTLQLPIVAPA